jgi:hypothetical protein
VAPHLSRIVDAHLTQVLEERPKPVLHRVAEHRRVPSEHRDYLLALQALALQESDYWFHVLFDGQRPRLQSRGRLSVKKKHGVRLLGVLNVTCAAHACQLHQLIVLHTSHCSALKFMVCI